MKIQLNDKKIIKDAEVVWTNHGPEVDIQMDLKNLTFKPGSIEEIYAFHVLDGLFPNEISIATQNWFKCLKPGGKLFVIVDDFEYIARGFVGGDISIGLFNELHSHPTQFTRDNLLDDLKRAGFKENNISIWYATEVAGKFNKSQTELVLESKKNE